MSKKTYITHFKIEHHLSFLKFIVNGEKCKGQLFYDKNEKSYYILTEKCFDELYPDLITDMYGSGELVYDHTVASIDVPEMKFTYLICISDATKKDLSSFDISHCELITREEYNRLPLTYEYIEVFSEQMHDKIRGAHVSFCYAGDIVEDAFVAPEIAYDDEEEEDCVFLLSNDSSLYGNHVPEQFSHLGFKRFIAIPLHTDIDNYDITYLYKKENNSYTSENPAPDVERYSLFVPY